MAEILVLDHATIDKIAAGEVVERPASVVKELVENAIDAGANAITVEIKDGGTSFIRVTDNGMGIPKDQVRRAFLRHATSKIKTVEDLFQVSSLGFRGEALSSIAAIAQVEFITKTKDSLTGIRYVIEGAKENELEEIGAPSGTTILVRNLFFNTPVRRNFLKSAATEGAYISDLMEHLALSKPAISFQYHCNNKVKFHTSGNGDLGEIIYRIYGREIAKELLEFKLENTSVKITGFLGKPTITRSNRNFENYFVNHRYIKSDFLSKAIEQGYQSFLMQHKYPFTVLHFEILPECIDINVHPTKMDIRFTNQTEFHEFLADGISAALQKEELIANVSLPQTAEEKKEIQDIVVVKHGKTPFLPEPFEENRIWSDKVKEEPIYAQNVEKTSDLQELLQKHNSNKVLGNSCSPKSGQNENIHANIIKSKDHIIVEKPAQMNLFEEKLLAKDRQAPYKILGQVFDTYWLLSLKDRLFYVDQHAAHEKVKYERLVKKIAERNVESQILNPPIIVSLTAKEEAAYEESKDYFLELGFEIEVFGGTEYSIRSVPTELFGCNEKQLFEEIMDELCEHNLKGTPTVMKEKLASMACKAAIKGNHNFSVEEMKALFDELVTLENPYHCPHGRPTIIAMTKYELDKKFKRIL